MNNKKYLLLLFVILLSLGTSCSKHIYQSEIADPVLYPPPPDTARIQFLARYENSFDFTGNQSKFSSFVVGQKESLQIIKPYGIATHDGKIFIADPEIAGLHIIDLEAKTFENFTPGGRGKFKLPINCFVGDSGHLYVADVERQQVVIYDENLKYIGEIGGSENFKPTDVIVNGDIILITDPNNHRINGYNRLTSQKLFSFPELAKVGDKNWLYNPTNLCVINDKVYITDFGDSRIKIFDMDGGYLGSVGSFGRNLGQFVRPKGIAVDKEENLYVVDAGFENVQIFNNAGQLLLFFGGPYQGLGDMYLPANVFIDYDNLGYFREYVDPAYNLKYLIIVTNQYGPDKVSVYGRIEPK